MELRLDATCAVAHECVSCLSPVYDFTLGHPLFFSRPCVYVPGPLASTSPLFLILSCLRCSISLSLSLSLSLPHGVALAGSIRCTHVHDELHPLLRHAVVIVGQTVRATWSMDSGVDGATSGSYDLACASEGDARKDARGAPLASPAKGRADVTPLRNCVSMHHFSVGRTSSRVCSVSPSSVLSFWPYSVSCLVCAG